MKLIPAPSVAIPAGCVTSFCVPRSAEASSAQSSPQFAAYHRRSTIIMLDNSLLFVMGPVTFPIYIYTVDREWIVADAILSDPWTPILGLLLDDEIPPGTSGTPVFDEEGDVVGIIYSGSAEGDNRVILFANALPGWALREIAIAGENHHDGLSDE